MSACSAAWTAPMMRDGSRPAASSVSSGTVYQQARVVSSRAGSRGARPRTPGWSSVRFRWYATRWCCTVDRAEVRDAGARRRRRLGGDDRDVGLLAGLGVLVGVVGGIEHGHLVLDVEVAHAVLTALVQVDRAGVRDVEAHATRRRCPPGGRRRRRAGTRPTNPCADPTRAAGGSRPAQYIAPPRGLSSSSSTRSRTASSRASPK